MNCETMENTKKLLTLYFAHLVASSPPGKKAKIGERQAASLLARALTDQIIEQHPSGDEMTKKLSHKNKRIAYRAYLGWREKEGLGLSNHLDLSNFLVYRFQDCFSRVSSSGEGVVWNLVGQADHPVMLVLKDSEKPLFPGEEDRLKKLLPKIEYREINYLCGTESGEHLSNPKTTGGGKETLNSYVHTYHLHLENQKFGVRQLVSENSLTKIWASQKIISLIKGFFPATESSLEDKISQARRLFGMKTLT